MTPVAPMLMQGMPDGLCFRHGERIGWRRISSNRELAKTQVRGQAVQVDDVGSAKYHGTLDDVLQLPHISRQRVLHQLLHGPF